MKRTTTLLFSLIFILTTLNGFSATNSSSGSIKGKITDAVTGEPLIGANIAIDGTSLGAASDLNGEYVIHNVPAGTYTIKFIYLGYKNQDQPNIILVSGETYELNVSLAPESILGEEVIVSAQAKGQMAAINQQRSSNSISNIVASDRIREVPDVNAAESIGRLPGVALKRSGGEGEQIVVRGLSPQHTIVEIDGVRMSGVGGDRSVGLSSISSEMLDGIELFKSLTADKDADAIGGVVNLRTRVADKGIRYDLLASSGYNGVENSFKNYKFGGGISNRFFDDKFGAIFNITHEKVIRSSDNFAASYSKNIAEEDDLYTSSATLTKNSKDRQRTNASIVLDYKSDFVTIKFNNIFSRKKDYLVTRNNIFQFNTDYFLYGISDHTSIESIHSHSLSSIFNIGNTKLDVFLSYSNTNLDATSDIYNFKDIYIMNGGSIPESSRLFAMPGDLITEFFDISSIDHSTLQNNVRGNTERDDVTKTAKLDWELPFAITDKISGKIKVGGKYSRKDRSDNSQYNQTYFWGGIGIGRAKDVYDNAFPEFLRPEDVGISNADGIVAKNFEDPNYDYGDFLDGRYELGWSADLDYLKFVFDSLYRRQGDDLDLYHSTMGINSNQNDYVNIEETMAGYIMAEINIGENIMLLPGLRYEKMQTQYDAKYILEDPFATSGVALGYPKDVSASRSNTHFFPSLNIKVDVTDWFDIRGAYYASASRPDYRLLSPSMVANNNKTRLIAYNPYLNPALADNFDLGFSLFSNKFGLFTVNLFYKEIDNLIYRLPNYQPEYFSKLEDTAPESLMNSLQAPQALYDSTLFKGNGTSMAGMPINNPNKTYFKGIEISWQTNLSYLPGLLSGLVLDLNYSYTVSSTEYPFINFERRIDSSGFIPLPIDVPVYETREGRMLDQPTSLYNARIGWDYKGFSSRVSFRYQGKTLSGLDPIHSLLDEYKGDMFLMDITIKQRITDRLSLSLDIANLTKYIDDRYVYAKGYNLPKRSEYYGSTGQLTLRYRL